MLSRARPSPVKPEQQYGARRGAPSPVADRHDLELDLARGPPHHHHVARALAEQRPADRRSPTDPACAAVALVLPDDDVRALHAVLALDLDRRAEEDLVALLLLRIDEDRALEPLGQVAHAPIDLAEALLAVDVLGVL